MEVTEEPVAGSPPRRTSMMWRGAIILVTIVSLAFAIHAMAPLRADDVERLLRSLGWPGFFVYVLYSLAVFGLLGAAWLLVMGARWSALPAFAWARLLREAASDLLPFSQIGGLVVGADALIGRGFPGAAVYAAMAADLTTEMTSQVLFTVVGIGLFATSASEHVDSAVFSTILLSLIVIVLLALLAWTAPRWIPSIAPGLLERVMPAALPIVTDVADRLKRLYAHRIRILGSTSLNLSAWTMSAAGAWLVLHWAGSDVPLGRVVSLEAFIFALRSVAFMVPGGIGVQEAGYALAAPLFGLPIESVVLLTIAKRCKDLAIGVPTLLVWQLVEAKKIAHTLRRIDLMAGFTRERR